MYSSLFHIYIKYTSAEHAAQWFFYHINIQVFDPYILDIQYSVHSFATDRSVVNMNMGHKRSLGYIATFSMWQGD